MPCRSARCDSCQRKCPLATHHAALPTGYACLTLSNASDISSADSCSIPCNQSPSMTKSSILTIVHRKVVLNLEHGSLFKHCSWLGNLAPNLKVALMMPWQPTLQLDNRLLRQRPFGSFFIYTFFFANLKEAWEVNVLGGPGALTLASPSKTSTRVFNWYYFKFYNNNNNILKL